MVFHIFIRFQCLEYYIVIVRYQHVFVHCLLVFVYVYVIYVNLNKEKRKLKKKKKKKKDAGQTALIHRTKTLVKLR